MLIPPEPAELLPELERILEEGGLRPAALEQCPRLLALWSVQDRARGDTTPELACAAESLLLEAIARLGPSPKCDAAQVLLATRAGTKGVKQADRRKRAGAVWGGDGKGVSGEHFRKNLEHGLLLDIAYEVYKLDAWYERRVQAPIAAATGDESKADSPTGGPLIRGGMDLSALMADRLTAYSRMWNCAYDLGAYLEAWEWADSDDSPEEVDPEDYVLLSLYSYTKFTLEVHRFIEEHGGLWILPNPEQEATVADVVHEILLAGPFSHIEQSRLRCVMHVLNHYEPDAFQYYLESAEAGRELVKRWRKWVTRDHGQRTSLKTYAQSLADIVDTVL